MHNMPAVMTLHEFEKATTVSRLQSRTHLVPMDNLLAQLEASRGKRVQDQITAMAGLIFHTDLWLSVRTDKNSDSASVRRGAVTRLGEQATARLEYLERIVDQGAAYEARKATGPAAGGRAKPLATGYANERAAYLKSDKKGPVPSGSSAADLTKFWFKDKPFTDLTVKQFTTLVRTHAADKALPTEVVFLRKLERLNYLVTVDPATGLMSRRTAAGGVGPVDTFGDALSISEGYPYAADRYGNFFAVGEREMNRLLNKNKTRFNHSSFLGGREVLCAGMMKVRAGRLEHLNNLSGHYQPSRSNLCDAMAVLRDAGIDLSGVEVRTLEIDPATKRQVQRTWANGEAFAASGGSVRPATEERE